MWRHSVDYLASEGHRRDGMLVHRGFWLYLPRPLVTCRLRGHKPVADGTEPFRDRPPAHMWVACDRCGVRPEPQGRLDPLVWDTGERWPGPDPDLRGGVLSPPGPWPASSTGTIGAELLIGNSHCAGVSVKVGHAGSEHTLAANVTLGPLGALYLHTEGFGTWLQRRLVPTGYESRVTEIRVHDAHLWWQVWHPRDSSTKGTPRWRYGNIRLDPRDALWGPERYTYVTHDGRHAVPVTMAPGETYAVDMKLKRQSLGRPGRRQVRSWSVDCTCRPGIPVKPTGGEILGWSVPVTSGRDGDWAAEAAAASAARMWADRARYGWRAPAPSMGDC